MSIIQSGDIDFYADIIAHYLPNGPIFDSKFLPDTNFRKILRSMASERQIATNYLIELLDNHCPSDTKIFIEEWERAVGIPDSCFDTSGTLQQRINQVLIKLYYAKITTKQDYITLASKLGFVITVTNGSETASFPLTFPFPLYKSDKVAKFTIIIKLTEIEASQTFDYEFDFEFSNPRNAILECLLTKLKPAHCQIIFDYLANSDAPTNPEAAFILQDGTDLLLQDETVILPA